MASCGTVGQWQLPALIYCLSIFFLLIFSYKNAKLFVGKARCEGNLGARLKFWARAYCRNFAAVCQKVAIICPQHLTRDAAVSDLCVGVSLLLTLACAQRWRQFCFIRPKLSQVSLLFRVIAGDGGGFSLWWNWKKVSPPDVIFKFDMHRNAFATGFLHCGPHWGRGGSAYSTSQTPALSRPPSWIREGPLRWNRVLFWKRLAAGLLLFLRVIENALSIKKLCVITCIYRVLWYPHLIL